MTENDKLPKPKRRWLRFSLRTLLIVLTVFCVWLGWHLYRAEQQREAVEWVLEHALRNLLEVDGIHDIRVEILPATTDDGWPRADTFWIISIFDRHHLPRSGLSSEFWDAFLPCDWLSYPRLDGFEIEPLTIPDGMCVFGFDYS